MNEAWPHQVRGKQETLAALAAGEKSVCLTSPTGGGKSRMSTDLIWDFKAQGLRSIFYTNRNMLREQLQGVLQREGIMHGLRASGFRSDSSYQVQLSSIQTEISRVHRMKVWELFPADRVFVDEAHSQRGPEIEKLLTAHKEAGAAIIGLTATPVDLAHMYDKLIVAGTNSELRECGAHVVCHTYAPDEPDIRSMPKKVRVGEDLTEQQNKKAMMRPNIFGRVFEHWKRLNPDGRPTILFAPDVASSIWFAEQFAKQGVTAAHIDGADISYGETEGEGADETSVTYQSNRDRRQEILQGSKEGRITVLTNRFVLREGIDAPWLYHMIGATIFGSLSSFLQAGGRLLRAHASLDHVVFQDHGGSYWRHGSLNADREWHLAWGNVDYAEERRKTFEEKRDAEPICCPKCSAVRLNGKRCPKCGHAESTQSRIVVQTDGTLRRIKGNIFKPRVVAMKSDTEKQWESIYWRFRKSGKTFKQAVGFFKHTNGYWPPRDLPNMPKHDADWARRIDAVEYSLLNQKHRPDDPQKKFA